MTEKRRKLIFFWTYREWGGAQIYFIAIMKVAKAYWDITVIIPKESSPEIIRYLNETGVSVEYIDTYLDLDPAPTISRKFIRQWSRIKSELMSLSYLTRYDLSQSILHIETSPWQSWIFITLLRLRRANVFVTLHNAPSTPAKWRRIVWRSRMRFVSRLRGFHIFTSNNDTKNKIRDLVTPAFWDDIAVTYTCVDPPQIDSVLENSDPIAIRDRHGIARGRFVVLCVGQFIDRKGRWVFLEAAKRLKSEHPVILFVWVTPSLPDDDTNTQIAKYSLVDNFRMVLSADIGSTREEILGFFRIADIYALPSLIEGLPIALLEAMALALPCISTNVYAIPEAVHHNDTGVLIEPNDPEALAGEIRRLKADPELRRTLGANGRKYVLENFDERVASNIAIAKYKECFQDAG